MIQDKLAAPMFLWRFADVEFDEASRVLRVGEVAVDLEPRPLEVLLQLLRHAGEVVSKEDLLDAVYGHRYLSDGALAQAIRRLRRALQDDGQRIVVTVHRVGYKLAVDVSRKQLPARRPHPLLLKAGSRVPHREHWKLVHTLGGDEVEIWLIEHENTHARRVLKLCTNAPRLSALKREVTLFRVLKESLGERDDLVTLIDWNFNESPYFIECEYGGITLVEWAQSLGGLAAIPIQQRIQMIAAAAEAVAAAHSAQVLHKDLKPANILAYQASDGTWRPRLIDFGSGRLLEPDRLEALRITQQGFTQQFSSDPDSTTGTPLYLAPELIAGQMPTVQSDVYALGVMLYQLIIGDFRKPMTSGWEDDIDEESLRAAVACATHGNPLKRMKSARELAERLRNLDAGRRAIAPGPMDARPGRGPWNRFAILLGLALFLPAITVWQTKYHVHRPAYSTPTSAIADANDAYLHALTLSHRRQLSIPDWLEVTHSLQRAVALDPGFVSAWALLAQESAHLYFNHYDPEANRARAVRALEIAMKLQPDSPDTLIAKGYYSYWVDADYATATRVMQRVHENWPQKLDATIALARIARRQGRYPEGARYYEEALATDRLNLELVYGAGEIRLALQQFPAALKLAKDALDISPADIRGISLKAHIYQQLGDLAASAAVLKLVANRPGDFESVGLLAEQARLQRQLPAAIELWRAYLAKPEASPGADLNVAYRELGHLLLMNGDKSQAIVILRSVRQSLEEQRAQQPSDPRPVAQLALVCADLGEVDVARTLANSAASFEVVRRDAARRIIYEAIRANVATRTGDKDQAFASLRLLMSMPFDSKVTPGLLALDPEWDELRADSRFTTMLRDAARAQSHAAIL